MKRKPIMRILTLTLTMILMLSMSVITVFAAGDEDTCTAKTTEECINEDCTIHCFKTVEECDRENCPVHCSKTAEECDRESCPVHKSRTDKADKQETVSGNNISNKEDVNSAKAGNDQKEKIEGDKSGMSANIMKKDAETVKTGERNIIPIIIGLAVIAAGAGTGFVIYKKKQE